MQDNDEVRMTNDELEASLANLTPVAPQFDRDTLMYQAGYAAASRSLATPPQHVAALWKTTTFLATAAALAFGVMLVQSSQPGDSPLLVDAKPQASPTNEPGAELADPALSDPLVVESPPSVPRIPNHLLLADPSTNYLALRAAVLLRGVETWPTDYREPMQEVMISVPTRTSTMRGLMEELLPPNTETNPAELDPNKDADSLEAITTNKESIV